MQMLENTGLISTEMVENIKLKMLIPFCVNSHINRTIKTRTPSNKHNLLRIIFTKD